MNRNWSGLGVDQLWTSYVLQRGRIETNLFALSGLAVSYMYQKVKVSNRTFQGYSQTGKIMKVTKTG